MRRLGWLLRRLALALGAFVLTVLLLELLVRVLWPAPPPLQIAEGLYAGQLPLVNGRPDGRWAGRPDPSLPALPANKAPDEIRVVTFGESSMEGCPWGHTEGPAAFLLAHLRASSPGEGVTVVNLGKTSSFLMDTWYYLVAARDFQPDYVVFYQGSNERYDLDPEACAPVNAPRAHALWRWLVTRSHLLWTVRVMGPEIYLSLSGGAVEGLQASTTEGTRRCLDRSAFDAWADLAVRAAREMGATPIVVSFTDSDLAAVQKAVSRGDGALGATAALLACPLDAECRAAEILARVSPHASTGALGRLVLWLQDQFGAGYTDLRWFLRDQRRDRHQDNAAWRSAAERHGGLFVDFDALVRELPEAGAWLPPVFVDGVHLSVAGYAILGEQMARAILAHRSGESVPTEGFWRPERSLDEWYAEVERRTGQRPGLCDTMLQHGDSYFNAGQQVGAGFEFRDAARFCPPERVAPYLERYGAWVEGLRSLPTSPDEATETDSTL